MSYTYNETRFTYDSINVTYDGSVLYWIFTPPTDPYLNLTDFDVETPPTENLRVAFRLLRHFQSLPRGRNVYKLDDNTYTENEPADSDTIQISYLGGHTHTVTDEEAVSLTSAGYGAYIT
jgi:hypothetical protein